MFAVLLHGFNLSDPTWRFYDIVMYQEQYSPVYQPLNITQIPLVTCTREHFNFS